MTKSKKKKTVEEPEEVNETPEQIETEPTGNTTDYFREKVITAMSSIKNIKDFRESDKMVDYVFKIGRELFENPLDTMTPDMLISRGGKLTGAFAYLGQMASYSRAERDVYEQKKSEVSKELVLKYLSDGKYKVTEAKSRAEIETSEISDLVITKDAEKNQWENVLEATQSMISFIQSAIKVKEGERFSGSRLHNNGY